MEREFDIDSTGANNMDSEGCLNTPVEPWTGPNKLVVNSIIESASNDPAIAQMDWEGCPNVPEGE